MRGGSPPQPATARRKMTSRNESVPAAVAPQMDPALKENVRRRFARAGRTPFLLLLYLLPLVLPAGGKDVEGLLKQGKVEAARNLCRRLPGCEAAWSWPLLGDHYLNAGDLEPALDCYRQGIPVIGMARALALQARRSLERGDRECARQRYGEALQAFETLLRDDRCLWEPSWNDERLQARAKWQELGGGPGTEADEERLRSLLRRAAGYCRRLESALLDFICEEEVNETVRRSHPLADVLSLPVPGAGGQTRRLFDYRLVSEDGSIRESRTLLRRSGKPAGLVQSDLVVSHYSLSKMIYTPIDFFSSGQNPYFVYRIMGETSDADGPLFEVEALPLVFPSPPLSFGRAWLRPDGRVERIELNYKSIQDYETIYRAARRRRCLPAVSFVIELGRRLKGIGFPSAIDLRDAFRDEEGRESVASEVAIRYAEFRFFRVETQEEIKPLKPEPQK